MASRRLARFLLIFTALLLPLQAVAGVTMGLCRHDAAPQAATVAGEHEHCASHDAAPAAPEPTTHAQGCDDCGVCHLACSGYMAASEIRTDAAPRAHVFQGGAIAVPFSHIPEPPGYPPRRSA